MRPGAELILPCYNPPEGWQDEVNKLMAYLQTEFDIRLIIIDDGTTTQDLRSSVRKLDKAIPLRLISLETNKGKGHALRRGVQEASSAFLAYTDIDIPFTAESVAQLFRVLCGGEFDVVAGYRNSSYYENTMSAPRRRLSKTFRLFMRRVLKISLDDTQCGLKGFNSKGRAIFLATKVDRYLFDFEFIYQALRNNSVRVGSVPVHLKENVQFSSMKWPVIVREGLSLTGVLWRSLWNRS